MDTPNPVIQYLLSAEKKAEMTLATTDDFIAAQGKKLYLYEPDAALLKAGCFKLVCQKFNIRKIAPETHIYLSETLVRDFPGRVEQVIEMTPFSKKNALRLAAAVPGCSIIARNFPMKSEELRKMISTEESQYHRLIATRNCLGEKIIILTCLIPKSSGDKPE